MPGNRRSEPASESENPRPQGLPANSGAAPASGPERANAGNEPTISSWTLDSRDPQQVMDDNLSERQLGDLELERRPSDVERMKLGKVPNPKKH